MNTLKTPIILSKEDHDLILFYLRSGKWRSPADSQSADKLEGELKRAKIVTKENLGKHIVQLNSLVRVRDLVANKLMELMIVTPDKANLKEMKISVLSPVGTALIGFGQGDYVKWKVPAGERLFVIEEVIKD
jgi:regulator of nucleoside diphosphate kinase